MKIKVTKPDGTVIEAEGTAEECRTLLEEPAKVEYVPMPYQPVLPYTPPVFPYGPDTYPFTVDTIIITCEPSTASTVIDEKTPATNTMYLSIPDLSSEEMQERLKTFRTEWKKANMGRTLGRGHGGYIPNCS